MPGMFDLPEPPSTPAQRLQMALAIFSDGLAMEREKLRRQHPQASEAELSKLLAAWLHSRPMAPDGDCDGRPRRWNPAS
jgi:hypothetical protein